jgi:branched-subunit amino acid aminotransferase/4-amino-4-deoxychorismate lyase
LPGVTRALLLDEIRVPGLSAVEADLTPSQLEGSDQIFITSTTRDLLPVLSIDGQPMNQDLGALASLASAFAAYRAGYVASRAALDTAIPA